jgi:hypothetical protein
VIVHMQSTSEKSDWVINDDPVSLHTQMASLSSFWLWRYKYLQELVLDIVIKKQCAAELM